MQQPDNSPPSRDSSSDGNNVNRSALRRLLRVLGFVFTPFGELCQVHDSLKVMTLKLLGQLTAVIVLNYKCIKIRREMTRAASYKEYERLGLVLDRLQGKEAWKKEKVSPIYDWQRIESRLENMRALRLAKDITGLVHCLRQDLQKNVGGICNPRLYDVCKVGTKELIEEYHNETIKCIQFIYYYQGSKLNLQGKLEFFGETRHSYGRTALFLSGGASFGKFHFGVMKALYEQDLFPRTIAGSSVGSLVAGAIASHKYADLWKCFSEEYKTMTGKFFKYNFNTLGEALQCLRDGKPLLDQETLKKAAYRFLKDDTFLELYNKNKWNLNITVTDGIRQSDSKLLNHITAPNVLVWTAVIASCAIPCVYKPVELLYKTESGEIKPYYMSQLKGNYRYVDGSVACDLPMQRMSELFNINTFIVSQVNPHIAPFISSDAIHHDQTRLRRKVLVKLRTLAGAEFKHWVNQLAYLGVFPQYIKGLAELVTQSYQGHVTIAPRPSRHDYARLIADPLPEGHDAAVQETYSQTIQRISHIRAYYGIEREFDRYYLRLKSKMSGQVNLRMDKDVIKYQINKTLVEKHLQKQLEEQPGTLVQADDFIQSNHNELTFKTKQQKAQPNISDAVDLDEQPLSFEEIVAQMSSSHAQPGGHLPSQKRKSPGLMRLKSNMVLTRKSQVPQDGVRKGSSFVAKVGKAPKSALKSMVSLVSKDSQGALYSNSAHSLSFERSRESPGRKLPLGHKKTSKVRFLEDLNNSGFDSPDEKETKPANHLLNSMRQRFEEEDEDYYYEFYDQEVDQQDLIGQQDLDRYDPQEYDQEFPPEQVENREGQINDYIESHKRQYDGIPIGNLHYSQLEKRQIRNKKIQKNQYSVQMF